MPNPSILGPGSLQHLSDIAEEIGWQMDSLRRRLQLLAQTGDHETLADVFPRLESAIDELATVASFLADNAHQLQEGEDRSP